MGQAYSFVNVVASIIGPGGAFQLGASAGATKEGLTVAYKEELSTMTFGADGEIMQALHAARPGRISVRLLKTSPINGFLSAMFNFQQASAANWGQNTIRVSDIVRGDSSTLSSAAFVKPSDITYDEGGRFNEWVFDGALQQLLGTGL